MPREISHLRFKRLIWVILRNKCVTNVIFDILKVQQLSLTHKYGAMLEIVICAWKFTVLRYFNFVVIILLIY